MVVVVARMLRSLVLKFMHSQELSYRSYKLGCPARITTLPHRPFTGEG